MAFNDVDVEVNLKGDTSDIEKDLNKTSKALDRLHNRAMRASDGFHKVGVTMSLMAAPIIALGYTAVQAASQAEESENLFEVSFGNMANAARAWSDELSAAVGISAYTIREQSAMLFTMTSSMGIAEDQAYGLATGLTTLAQDMASFYNLPIEQAFMKLQAGITGEAEPLKRLGILVGENFVKQTDFARSIEDTGRKMTEQEKVLARYYAIMDQTKKAQGDLLRTQDSFVNMSRRAKEQMKDLNIAIGQELLPMLQTEFLPAAMNMVDVAKDMVEWYKNLSPVMKDVANVVGGLALAAGPAALVMGQLISAAIKLTPVMIATKTSVLGMGAAVTLLPTALKGGTAGINAWGSALGKAGQGLIAFGVLIASYKMTNFILEITGARKAIDDLVDTIIGLDKASLAESFDLPKVWEGGTGPLGLIGGAFVEQTEQIEQQMEFIRNANAQLGESFEMTSSGLQKAQAAMDVWRESLSLTAQKTNIAKTYGVEFAKELTTMATIFEKTLLITTEEARAMAYYKLTTEGATDAAERLTKAEQKAAAAREKAIQSLAAGLGTQKLVGEAKKMSAALAVLNARGEEVSSQGLQQVVDMFEKLKAAGEDVPGVIQDIVDAIPTGPLIPAGSMKLLEKGVLEGLDLSKMQDLMDDAFAASIEKAGASFATKWSESLLGFEGFEFGLPGFGDVPDDFDASTDSVADFSNSIRDLAAAFQVLGIDATSTIGAIIAGVSQLGAAIPAIKDQTQSIMFDEKGNKLGRGMAAGAQGVAGVIQATSTGSQAQRALGGAMQGAAAGGQIGGPIGAAVGAAVGAIVGWARGAGPAQVMKTIGEKWGLDISQELAETISKTADELDLGKFEAAMLHLGDIIREQGGLSEENLDSIRKAFNDLLNAVALKAVPAAEGMAAISDAFPQIIEGLEEMGMKGSIEIGKLISRMKELGIETDEVLQFIKETGQSAVSNFSIFFEYLAKQTELTNEQATAAITQMAGAFSAAVAATGTLVGAIALLGDSFGELLVKIREVVGEENALLNGITQYYNYVKNNEEQLGAIEALGAGFQDLIKLGIINKENIADYAASFKMEMESMLAAADDPNMALMAMGPTIGMLLEGFHEMGVAVPQWLSDIAEQAIEANANLEPPEGLPDILKDIRDIMLSIADALGAAGDNAKKFGDNLKNVKPPSGDFSYNPDEYPGGAHGLVARGYDYPELAASGPRGIFALGAQHGLVIPPKPGGTPVVVGEGGKTELIAPVKDLANQIGMALGTAITTKMQPTQENFHITNDIKVEGVADAEAAAEEVMKKLETNQGQALSRIFRKARTSGQV